MSGSKIENPQRLIDLGILLPKEGAIGCDANLMPLRGYAVREDVLRTLHLPITVRGAESGILCPSCGTSLHCGCESCRDQNVGKTLFDGNNDTCPVCDYGASDDHWLDLSTSPSSVL